MLRAIGGICAGVLTLLVIAIVLLVRVHTPASQEWKAFSIGPPSGNWTNTNPGVLRGDGVTLLTMIGVAYEMPAVRIIAPGWVGGTRYAVNVVAPENAPESLRPLLQQEIKNRFRLQTHTEVRPFDVFLLSAGVPHLEHAAGGEASSHIHEWDAEIENAPLAKLASALQGILGKPVLDETGIEGTYKFELSWGENRAASITAFLDSHYGLRLSTGKRDMQALIVDYVQPDMVLSLFSHVETLTRKAPARLRQHISNALSIH